MARQDYQLQEHCPSYYAATSNDRTRIGAVNGGGDGSSPFILLSDQTWGRAVPTPVE